MNSKLNSNSNVRYNSSNDMVEIKIDDTWQEWKTANLQGNYLYKDGEIIAELDATSYTVGSYTQNIVAFGMERILLSLKARTTGTVSAVLGCANNMDLTDFSKLCLEYTYNGTVYTNEVSLENITNGYIYFGITSPNVTYINVTLGVSSVKTSVNSNQLVANNARYEFDVKPGVNVYINKVWLE